MKIPTLLSGLSLGYSGGFDLPASLCQRVDRLDWRPLALPAVGESHPPHCPSRRRRRHGWRHAAMSRGRRIRISGLPILCPLSVFSLVHLFSDYRKL